MTKMANITDKYSTENYLIEHWILNIEHNKLIEKNQPNLDKQKL